MKLVTPLIMIIGLLLAVSIAAAQSSRNAQQPRESKPADARPAERQPEIPPANQDLETIKIDTNLVTVPVIASSRSGNYIGDLRREEFRISEDGVAQEIAFFATVSAPFQVVLMLDTSASTEEKLGQIQQAAIAFVEQLSSADKVKVISFDNDVRDLNEFTSDKQTLRSAIKQTRSGTGTRLYDAMQMALDILRPVKERKAIVIFTDGVDWHSDSATFDGTVRGLDESGVIIYPVRFDTRADTERIIKQQEEGQNGVQLPTSDVIRQSPPGTTPQTFPSDEPFPVPAGQPRRSTLPLPLPSVIFGRRGSPSPPSTGSPSDPFPDTGARTPGPSRPTTAGNRRDDGLGAMLDSLYLMADSYLKELADRSGGQVYRADTVGVLPQAFSAIAAELRTQYLLGYYPTNRTQDGGYRKIQVKVNRKDIAVRARPGYRARSGG